ncbi:SET domain-containing protein-lysine N-methyltransferase [Candidatus Neptunochlamydia vexilliferae]|nr:SET domain-containing protein-lysine N-methyltransferase [Candidatus Neptunochlamydia vexilliferae]
MAHKKRVDPMFKKYFDIETPIVYLENIKVQKKVEDRFNRSWKRFYKKAEPLISDFRQERFDAFFRQLERDGCDERYNRRIAIRFINPVVGYGVFAKEDIPPYSTLVQYTGLLMLDDDIDPDHDSTFSFSDYKTYSIDAAKHGNWARFMNHCAEGEAKNNAIPWEYYTEKGPRIVFTSGAHGIKKGKQILYSYGDEYWTEKKCVKF